MIKGKGMKQLVVEVEEEENIYILKVSKKFMPEFKKVLIEGASKENVRVSFHLENGQLKDETIRKLEKFVEEVRGVMGFGYETMQDMIKDLEIYLKELEK